MTGVFLSMNFPFGMSTKRAQLLELSVLNRPIFRFSLSLHPSSRARSVGSTPDILYRLLRVAFLVWRRSFPRTIALFDSKIAARENGSYRLGFLDKLEYNKRQYCSDRWKLHSQTEYCGCAGSLSRGVRRAAFRSAPALFL